MYVHDSSFVTSPAPMVDALLSFFLVEDAEGPSFPKSRRKTIDAENTRQGGKLEGSCRTPKYVLRVLLSARDSQPGPGCIRTHPNVVFHAEFSAILTMDFGEGSG